MNARALAVLEESEAAELLRLLRSVVEALPPDASTHREGDPVDSF